MTTKLLIEYDGAGFAGWARQLGLRTVQGVLEEVLEKLLGEPLGVTVAGRTDRGVHAWGQVASYRHEQIDPVTLNALLPDDVAVLASEPQSEGFDARRDAISRTYCYRVLARRGRGVFERGHALWHRGPLDRRALHACATALAGTHDFTAFTPTQTDHVRFERHVLGAEWRDLGDVLELWIEADSFMRQMNRVLVGTMLEVARGALSVSDFERLLAGRPRGEAGPTAPPHGLHLAVVRYAPAG